MTANPLKSILLGLCLSAVLGPFASSVAVAQLQLQPGDHVCLIGNALPERMQYFGYFETLLHRQFPQHSLVVRNLGFAGDEVRFRPRSLDFGTPDQHLTMQQADVIIAFFGLNESFSGPDGLPTFQQELEQFVTHTLQQQYNGKSAPRLVLVSPIAFEQTNNPHLPDGSAANTDIEAYSKVMQSVAAAHDVPFVDLYKATRDLFDSHPQNLTFNGIHLTEDGYRSLAPLLMKGLFGTATDWSGDLEGLRAEVNEKCFQFFHRYRAVNGYYIYGGRSRRDHGNPPYTDAYVIENERGKLDDMTAVRDARIWMVAQGSSVPAEIDDSKTRPLYDVPTNFKQPIELLPPEEAKKKFVIADGYDVNLFASEVDFPDLQNPVQITFDLQGRCWVATMPSYPQYLPPHKPNDKILVFEDTDGDGKADRQTVFADGLHLPTGFELGDQGVYVAQEPNLMHIKDTDGDLVGDERRLLLHGFDSGDSHHAIGAFTWGPGGGLYMHEGTFHVTQVETPYGPVRNAHGAVYRYEPTREKFETFVHYNFANPWGSAFDEWGQTFVADASGGANYFGTAFSTKAPQYTGQEDFGPFRFAYQEQMQQWFPKRVRPTSGCEFVSSRHFPPEAQGNFLLNNVIGFQGVLQHTVKEVDSGFEGKEIEPLLYSTDRNFRPVDLEFGGDGALYIIDWFNPLIGHMQHSLRDPNRDKNHGRIWRITAKGRDLLTPPAVNPADVAGLVALLTEPEDRVRYRVRLKLREFATAKVVAALRQRQQQLIATADADLLKRFQLEALWVCQHHDALADPADDVSEVALQLLESQLASDDHRVRSAAVRVLCYSRHAVEHSLDLLHAAVNDAHPRVRLEAVRACSFFETPRAAEIALEALRHPVDYYIDYTLRHTIRRLETYWMPSLGTGQPFAVGNPKAIEYIIGRVKTPDLLGMRRSEPVYHELLTRDGIVHSFRMEAVKGLASLHNTSPVSEALTAIRSLDQSSLDYADNVIADMTHIVTMQSATALREQRADIADLAATAKRDITRRVATVALIAADGSADRLWNDAGQDINSLRSFVDAVPLIQDAAVRESLYDRIHSLLMSLPEALETKLGSSKATTGRYVRIELPGNRRTLTLAEVEVISAGRNVARSGKATQSATAHAGSAARAIDGNTAADDASGSQTHTPEDQPNPWWEVDLGSEYSLESIHIWNRSEQNLGDRLNGFTIKVLDSQRNIVFASTDNPAPLRQAVIKAESDPRIAVRRTAVLALAAIPGHEQQSFQSLRTLIEQPDYRDVVMKAAQQLDLSTLPAEQTRPVLQQLITFITSVPPSQRTEGEAIDAIQLARDLSTTLPKDEALEFRRQISELAIDVFVVRPIPHRMQYDRSHLYVQAGKPFEIVFENTDIMPHNLVVTQPDSREEIGILAEKMGASPDAFKKQFIPDSPKVLHASGMLQPGEQQKLQLTAPTAAGEYQYVCTFPGHWRTMWGTLHVVNDISEIPLDSMQQITEAEQLPKRQFIRKWKLEDLQPALSQLNAGRLHARGEALFKEVSCVQCHRMKGQGGAIGPDLVTISEKLAAGKMTPADVLASLLTPSKDIEQKYRTQIIVTADGKLASGVIVNETPRSITLAANPLDKDARTIEIAKDDIDEREESKVSIMPEGLLDTMTRDEILDLLAWILAAGKESHPAFSQYQGQKTGGPDFPGQPLNADEICSLPEPVPAAKQLISTVQQP
jgi:putative membrane-bound dehydrogenase-like protein